MTHLVRTVTSGTHTTALRQWGAVITGQLYIVDDDPALRRLLTPLAQSDGWTVVECADGSELHARLGHEPGPAVVVLDLNMPEMDGIALLRSLSGQPTQLALLIMTGGFAVNAKAARVIAETSGMVVIGILFKPFPLDHFREALARAAECDLFTSQSPVQGTPASGSA
jgi:CheY-like chemotaxis protein